MNYPNFNQGGYMPSPYHPAYPTYQPRIEPQSYMPPMPSAPQTAQQPQMNQPNMICRPVASEEEARAVPTDFSGATLILTDFGHGKVYTKSLNYADGSANFQVYKLENPMQSAAQTPIVEYAPMSVVQALGEEIERLKQALSTQQAPLPDKPSKQPKGSADK